MKYLAYTRCEFLRGFRYRANYWATLVIRSGAAIPESSFRYRANYWATLGGAAILVVIQWSLWTAVYRNTGPIAGISLGSMISYAMMGRVVSGFLSEPVALPAGKRIWSGEIVHDLVKPADLHFQLLFQNLGNALYKLVSTGLPLLTVLWSTGVLKVPRLPVLAVFAMSMLMGYVTVFSTSLLSAVITFHTKSRVGIDHVYTVVELLSGLYFPLDFFPGWLRRVADFLPFKSIHYVPLGIWSGIIAPGAVASSLLHQLIWTILMVVASRVLWSGALRSLTIQGG